MNTQTTDKATPSHLAKFIENETVSNKYGTMIRAEHAALVAVAEAAKHFGVMTATSQFSALQQVAQSALAQSLANLATIRKGGSK